MATIIIPDSGLLEELNDPHKIGHCTWPTINSPQSFTTAIIISGGSWWRVEVSVEPHPHSSQPLLFTCDQLALVYCSLVPEPLGDWFLSSFDGSCPCLGDPPHPPTGVELLTSALFLNSSEGYVRVCMCVRVCMQLGCVCLCAWGCVPVCVYVKKGWEDASRCPGGIKSKIS